VGGLTAQGKKVVLFNQKNEQSDPSSFRVPCGKCVGCSLERARQWAIRCKHEADMHEENAFVTLTYNDENLPENGSLVKRDVQLFFKSLRKKTGKKIRYFYCGEYGPKLSRPHYHALIFGYSFPDRQLFKEHPFRWYRSKELEELWKHGFSTIGEVTGASASYVARYTLKKVYGKDAKSWYGTKQPEYIGMSRMPGIGARWFDKFHQDIYPAGVYIHNGVPTPPPRYYDLLYGKKDPARLEQIKRERSRKATDAKVTDVINGKRTKVSNSDSFRLPVREAVKLSQLRELKRSLEEQE